MNIQLSRVMAAVYAVFALIGIFQLGTIVGKLLVVKEFALIDIQFYQIGLILTGIYGFVEMVKLFRRYNKQSSSTKTT